METKEKIITFLIRKKNCSKEFAYFLYDKHKSTAPLISITKARHYFQKKNARWYAKQKQQQEEMQIFLNGGTRKNKKVFFCLFSLPSCFMNKFIQYK